MALGLAFNAGYLYSVFMKIIRSDRLSIKSDSAAQREALADTLGLYRRLVRDLMSLAFTRWPQIGSLQGNAVVQAIEGLMHPTSRRPEVRYTYFHRRYYKFPSYLRRVAIMDAVGQVRSFQTRYRDWQDSDRRKQPPALTCSTSTFPSLYKGQCVRFSDDLRTAFIKVWHCNDWLWMSFQLGGKCRYRGKGKSLSPLLVFKGNRWSLSLPEEFSPDKKASKKPPTRVLSLDVGINTAATWAVVDAQGTVHARGFIQRSDKDCEHHLMQRIRSTASKHARHGSQLPVGFCTRDHRRLKQLADNEAHQISRRLINLALKHDCQAIVVEQLKGWRPTAGRKRSPMKARFHRWFHRMLVNRVHSKAVENGLRGVAVYARGTSSQAFDGSGPVRRDAKNYSLCTFSSGKRYHADLNAAYNIAARGFVYYQGGGRKSASRATQQKPDRTPRIPVTLSTLWNSQAA